jgi:glutamyl-tRNA reductase
MHIIVFGLSHNTAPIEAREKLYIPETAAPAMLEELKKHGIDGTIILSTCNRTEIYSSGNTMEGSLRAIRVTLIDRFGIQPEWLDNYTYTLFDEEAYRHLFRVAAGLDSMVVGEPQILGQVKDAYRLSTLHNSTGFLMDRVFHRTFSVAKRVRSETKIGYNPVSISSMAVELSKKIFISLNRKKILAIGAGEMCEIALKHFKKEGVSEIFVTNRTFQSAQRLAEEYMGIPCAFDEIPELLTRVDMVLSSTGAERPIISKDLVTSVMKKRKSRPLFFIDIAVPRDIDPLANKIENVYLYDIDDLRGLSQQHLSDRTKESEKARTIIEEEVTKFSGWLKQLDVTPIITGISQKAEEIRVSEMRKTMQKLRGVDEETESRIDALTKAIVSKILHLHITLIRENSDPEVVDVMKKLFQLEEENENEMDRRDPGE